MTTLPELIGLLQREMEIALPLDPDTPLISAGLIESLRVAELLALLEQRYQVRIDPADVGADNFDTARQIHRFLETCR